PGKQESDFKIEDDEENRDQVEPDVEFHARVVKSIESAFIGGELFRIGLLESQDEGCNQQHQADQPGHSDKDDKWKIALQDAGHRRYLFLRVSERPQTR